MENHALDLIFKPFNPGFCFSFPCLFFPTLSTFFLCACVFVFVCMGVRTWQFLVCRPMMTSSMSNPILDVFHKKTTRCNHRVQHISFLFCLFFVIYFHGFVYIFMYQFSLVQSHLFLSPIVGRTLKCLTRLPVWEPIPLPVLFIFFRIHVYFLFYFFIYIYI